MEFKSDIFILPGLGNSGEHHWQTHWEETYGFTRIQQDNWDTPVCSDWIHTIDEALKPFDYRNVILVGHSLACATIGYWAKKYSRKIKGALLVAPSDTEAATYPPGTTGFAPMPTALLPFPSITVASINDYYVTIERARYFSSVWGSKIIEINNAGHINVESGFGEWQQGLELLQVLE